MEQKLGSPFHTSENGNSLYNGYPKVFPGNSLTLWNMKTKNSPEKHKNITYLQLKNHTLTKEM